MSASNLERQRKGSCHQKPEKAALGLSIAAEGVQGGKGAHGAGTSVIKLALVGGRQKGESSI